MSDGAVYVMSKCRKPYISCSINKLDASFPNSTLNLALKQCLNQILILKPFGKHDFKILKKKSYVSEIS